MAHGISSEKFWTAENFTTGDLGTLANETALTIGTRIDSARQQGVICDKVKYFFEMFNKGAADGPLEWGFSYQLSAAEVAETLLADPQFDGNQVDWERVLRKIWPMGYIGFATTVSHATPDQSVNVLKTARMPGWHIVEGSSLDIYIFNWGIALDTGSSMGGPIRFRQRWLSD